MQRHHNTVIFSHIPHSSPVKALTSDKRLECCLPNFRANRWENHMSRLRGRKKSCSLTHCPLLKIIHGYCSGNLMASLAVTMYKPPFTTLEGLIHHPDFEVGVEGNSAWAFTLAVREAACTMTKWRNAHTLCSLVTPYDSIWVNIGSGNALVPDGTKLLPEDMYTCYVHLKINNVRRQPHLPGTNELRVPATMCLCVMKPQDSSHKGPVISNAKMMSSLLFNWKKQTIAQIIHSPVRLHSLILILHRHHLLWSFY